MEKYLPLALIIASIINMVYNKADPCKGSVLYFLENKMKFFLESIKKFKYIWILVIVFAAMIYIANETRLGREEIVYPEALDEVVATVEGQDITLRDFAVYVAHEEAVVQEQAIVYDEEDTRKYWSVRTKEGFVNQVARNEAMSMAIHDELFYQLSLELELTLTEEELKELENDVNDFWLDLVDEGKDTRLGITREDVYNTMKKIACAEKAQFIYAGMNGVDFSDYDYAKEEFLEFLSNYEYEVNEKVLNRIDFGDVTLTHE